MINFVVYREFATSPCGHMRRVLVKHEENLLDLGLENADITLNGDEQVEVLQVFRITDEPDLYGLTVAF